MYIWKLIYDNSGIVDPWGNDGLSNKWLRDKLLVKCKGRKRITYSTSRHTQKSVPDELKTYVKGTSLKFKKREREKTIIMLEQTRTVFKNKKCNIKNTNQKGKRLTNLTKKMDLQAIGKIHYGT